MPPHDPLPPVVGPAPHLKVFVKLVRAADAMIASDAKIMAAHGLTPSQFDLLAALRDGGELCQRDAARRMLKSAGNVTMVAGNLERRGLVARRRGEADRRYLTLSLTEAGQRLIGTVFPLVSANVAENLALLTETEQQTLARLCRKLGRGVMEREEASASSPSSPLTQGAST